ncbi:TetR/AcrR family transcriptional regulator [Enterococcus hermanniensis]|uniref:HTH tetR-type domain-containing protein n=1 Tax=Enterococcus hermanniensis TaxID=249189 RepID=A0A1L8TRK4_9ENTE|nr:TetR/AcrR family transcriptional regulator [Enterococcus hermanniensis]OJG46818.1 hypothetical protein RV04_GL000065 [Enterococcus hermanniensis]
MKMTGDVRFKRTEEKIYQALLELCQQKVDFETVSVRRLAEVAGISHQTFYRHYDSPKQVIIQVIDRHLAEFLKDFHRKNLTARKMVNQLLKIWNEREEVFQLLEWSDLRYEFIERLARFNQKIAEQNGIHLIDIEQICNVYAAAIYMFLRSYVLEKRWNDEQATELLLDLTNQMNKIF